MKRYRSTVDYAILFIDGDDANDAATKAREAAKDAEYAAAEEVSCDYSIEKVKPT